ncbi:NDP-hexose 2,3-dehydratase family protein [Actinomadura sp. HBU206391]|uniref:NDP-hexose 2,3-dehydratase family protein n=1 Tax=Actinomadura sp. HBU206391 TaxID=2731692 RepID=UPI002905E168|nr:NDP-hexose 2,3-dehydratase family protein [Actinomadura sp. HBU206391]
MLAAGNEIEPAEFHRNLEDVKSRIYTHAERIPLESLDHWYSDPDTGWLRHRSGKFFSVMGLRVSVSDAPVSGWCQPIINQPDTGILGILAKEINGVTHFLMQLKAEPGNRDGLQISPSVQATRSNYTGAHGGKSVPYLEYFRDAPAHRVLVDVRQSEQGSWFLRKRNRNMIVSTTDEIPAQDGFQWLTVGQVLRLLRCHDLVNMDTRTVLSCLSLTVGVLRERHPGYGDTFTAALLRSCDPAGGSHHGDREIHSWITEVRSRTEVIVEPVPLRALTGWCRSAESIRHETGDFFETIGMRVESAGREVGRWTQPMLATSEDGLIALLVTRIDGVLHALMHLRVEPGLVDVAELAPTVQCTPGNYAHLPSAARPAFLDEVRLADPEDIRFDTMLSDEGGRFYRISNRHLIVETDTVHAHPDYRWMAVHQLTELLRHCHYVNVQARSLVACLFSLLADPAPGAAAGQGDRSP